MEYHAGLGLPLCGVDASGRPRTGTIIDGTFAAHVGSVGAYAYVNDMLYLEASAYRTLNPGIQNDLRHRSIRGPGPVRRGALLARRLRTALGQQLARNRYLRHGGQRPPLGQPWHAGYLDFSPDRQIHGRWLRYPVPVSGRQLLVHVARQLHPRISEDSTPPSPISRYPPIRPTFSTKREAYASLAYGNDNQSCSDRPIFQFLGQHRYRRCMAACQRV